jgi:invasion protein IalB
MSHRIFATVVLVASGLSLAPAVAQEQPAAAPQPKAAPSNTTPAISGPQPDWVKICSTDQQSKKEICQTSRDLRAETGQTLASVAIREEKGGKRAIIMAIPPGMQIQPGVRVIVDQQPPVLAKFSVCFPNVCLVETEATDGLLGTLKKGSTLNLQALNVQARGVVFPISLKGFATAYDGAPIDPKVYQAEQRKLQDELKRRADEALKNLNAQAPASTP